MKVIAATTWESLVLVDIEEARYAVIHNNNRCWGLTWSSEAVFLMTWLGYRTVLNIFDLSFRRIDSIRFTEKSIIAPHQIIWLDGKIWISNTQYDYFNILDPRNGKMNTWRPANKDVYTGPHNRGNDIHHINGCWKNGNSIYVIAHNKERPSWIQEHTWPSLERVNRVPANSHRIHNIWQENGTFAVCSSAEGRIKSIDGSTLVNTGGFPRGVVITNGLRIIGVSSHHFKCKSRENVDGAIHLYDRGWNLRKFLYLDGFGQIYELRGLEMPDTAHYSGCEKVKFHLDGLDWRNSWQGPCERIRR